MPFPSETVPQPGPRKQGPATILLGVPHGQIFSASHCSVVNVQASAAPWGSNPFPVSGGNGDVSESAGSVPRAARSCHRSGSDTRPNVFRASRRFRRKRASAAAAAAASTVEPMRARRFQRAPVTARRRRQHGHAAPDAVLVRFVRAPFVDALPARHRLGRRPGLRQIRAGRRRVPAPQASRPLTGQDRFRRKRRRPARDELTGRVTARRHPYLPNRHASRFPRERPASRRHGAAHPCLPSLSWRFRRKRAACRSGHVRPGPRPPTL